MGFSRKDDGGFVHPEIRTQRWTFSPLELFPEREKAQHLILVLADKVLLYGHQVNPVEALGIS